MADKAKIKFDKTKIDLEVIQLMLSQNLRNEAYDLDTIELKKVKTDNMTFAEVKNFKAKGLAFDSYMTFVKLDAADLDNQVPVNLPNSTTQEMELGIVTKSRILYENDEPVIQEVEKTRLINKFVEVDGEMRPVWKDINTDTEYTILTEEQLQTLLADESKSMTPVKVEETYTVNEFVYETYEEKAMVPTGNIIQKTWRQYLRGVVVDSVGGKDAVGSLVHLISSFTIEDLEDLENSVTILSKKEYKEHVALYRPEAEV